MSLITKKYPNHFGIDAKSNDLNRDPRFAYNLRNSQNRKTSGLEKRKGYQAHADSCGGYGLFTYNRIDPLTALQEPEVVSVGSSLYRMLKSTLTVSYSGSESVAFVDIFYDPTDDEYKCQITEGVTLVGNFSLGKGFDEASTKTVDSLRSDIDSLTDFTATLTGATSTPAAFIKLTPSHELTASDYVGSASYWEEVNKTVTSPFAGSETNKDSLELENVSSVQLKNVMYLTNGYDYMQKYDGQTIFRAGMPTMGTISVAKVAGSLTTINDYVHRIRYVQKDNSGNITEGNTADGNRIVGLSSEDMDVTVDNIQDGTGFNTNCAIVAGAQGPVNTITVDDGSGGSHTMKVGDTAYFYDSVSGGYIEREVTGVTASDITVGGAAVTVADNAVISNNLRIQIFRSQETSPSITPTTFFFLEEIPNDSFAATQTYTDSKADAALGYQFLQPLVDRSLPPKAKYITALQERLFLGGLPEDANSVRYSDILSPEYFPVGINQTTELNVDTTYGDIVTGLAPSNEFLIILKSRSIFTVNGDFERGVIKVEHLTSDVGCLAHATIQEVKGVVVFLSDRGPYQMVGGQLPAELGEARVEPYFNQNDMSYENKIALWGTSTATDDILFKFKRAVAVNDRDGERYILYVPSETDSGGERYSNSFSRLFIFDYHFQAWHVWDSINMAGGATFLDGDMYHSERRYSDFNSQVDHIMYIRNSTGEGVDYEDNDSPIGFYYKPQWEGMGEYAVMKKFLRMLTYRFEETSNNANNITVNIEANFVRDTVKNTFEIERTGGGYGVNSYGTVPYGDNIQPFGYKKLRNSRYRCISPNFVNNEHQQNIIIPGWEIEVEAPYEAKFKS